MPRALHIDYFSGDVADLKPKQRTDAQILLRLNRSPRVSVWDMDKAWLRDALKSLERRRLIEELNESYPWLRYRLTKQGLAICREAIEKHI